MEDLDALAGDVAYRYVNSVSSTPVTGDAVRSKATIVTAAVDSLNFTSQLTFDRDIVVRLTRTHECLPPWLRLVTPIQPLCVALAKLFRADGSICQLGGPLFYGNHHSIVFCGPE